MSESPKSRPDQSASRQEPAAHRAMPVTGGGTNLTPGNRTRKVHVAEPATATEIRKALNISPEAAAMAREALRRVQERQRGARVR